MQCKDLSQLPRTEFCKDDEEMLLLIPRVAQEEIDRHKQEGNTRRGKRARKASSFIREIVLSDRTSLVIRNSKPFVRISFPKPSSHPCSLPDFLGLSRSDNQLIAEMPASAPKIMLSSTIPLVIRSGALLKTDDL